MSDQLVRAISKDGFVKAAAVSTRALTERARQIHQTSYHAGKSAFHPRHNNSHVTACWRPVP